MSKAKTAAHEPFMRMSKRDGLPFWKSMGIRFIGLTSMLAGVLLLFVLS